MSSLLSLSFFLPILQAGVADPTLQKASLFLPGVTVLVFVYLFRSAIKWPRQPSTSRCSLFKHLYTCCNRHSTFSGSVHFRIIAKGLPGLCSARFLVTSTPAASGYLALALRAVVRSPWRSGTIARNKSCDSFAASTCPPHVLFKVRPLGFHFSVEYTYASQRKEENCWCRYSGVFVKPIHGMASILDEEIGKGEVYIKRVKGGESGWTARYVRTYAVPIDTTRWTE